MSDDQPGVEAEILLQCDHVALYEVKMGKPVPVIEDDEALVISLDPRKEDIEAASLALNLNKGTIQHRPGAPLIFLVVGNYKIPIVPAIPVLQASALDYTFVMPNLFLQLIFPASFSPDETEAFETLIKNYGTLRVKPGANKTHPSAAAASSGSRQLVTATPSAQQPQKLSTRIALGIHKLSKVAAAGITTGTNVVASGLTKGAEVIVEKTDACAEPTKVSDSTKGAVTKVRMVSKGGVMMSAAAASSMVGVTAVLGNLIGGRVAKHISTPAGDDKLAGAKEVGVAAICCVGVIFDAASDGIKKILGSTCEGIATVVTHKLGEEAGAVTKDGLGVVQDAVEISQNVKKGGVKAIVKSTAVASAQQVMESMEAKAAVAPQ
jgi:hypothetical protein